MGIPRSDKLLRDQASKATAGLLLPENVTAVAVPDGPIPIKEVECLNDFVAILQFRTHSGPIELGEAGFKQEGMVVGVGPGLPTASGIRCQSQLKLGDVVSFYGNPTTTVEPKNGFYSGKKIVVYPERSMLLRLPPVPFTVELDEAPHPKDPQ
jgi:co-chaperonin GroES (HSP10)